MADAAVVQDFLDGFAAGEIEAALAVLHDDVEVSEPAGLPTGGEYHGKAGFLEFLGRVDAAYTVELGRRRVLDAGEFTVALIDTTWTSRRTGRVLATRFCELYTVADGLITAIDVFPKDTRALYDLTVTAADLAV